MGKKRNVKKREKWEKMDLSICIFVAFFLLFFCFCFAFILLFFCFLPGKKQKKSKTKAKKKQIEKAKKKQQKCKWTSPFFPIFSPFCLSFLFPFFFPFILLLCFLDFADLLFGFSFFLHFSRFFSSFKKIRISYGLVNINVVYIISASASSFNHVLGW